MPRGGSRNRGQTWSWTPEQRQALRERKAALKRERESKQSAQQSIVPPEPKKPQPQTGPMFTADAIQAIIAAVEERKIASRNRPRTLDWCPYAIHPERFGPVADMIRRKAPRMAMDSNGGIQNSNAVAVQAWMAGGLLNNVVSEGLTFLGYPYLSELAQRPEFRLFGEIRAEEMVRKFTEFRGTDDQSTKEEKKPKDRNADDDEADRRRQRSGEKPRSDSRNKEIETKIKELNDFAEELRVRQWFKDAAAQDSYFGISHLFMDLKGTNPQKLNDPELKTDIGNGRNKISLNKLGKGCLRGLRTIEPIWVYPTTYNAINPLMSSWYDPQVWYVMGTEIHKSRLLTMIGRPVPDILKPAYAFGGLSMTQMAQPYVDIWLKTRESVGEIIHAFSIMVFQTNLATTTQPGGAPGSGGGGDVVGRMILANYLRDNQGMMVIDKNSEDFKGVFAPLSGLEGLQAQSQEHMASVARTPGIKMFGIQPQGLNATSEGELRAFEDTIHGSQEHLFRSPVTTVYDIAQISLWGARDPDITYDFVPLREETPKEKAEMRKLDAETDQIRIDSGVVSQEEVRRKLAADEESGYDSIDPEDVPDLLGEEMEGLIPEGAGRGLQAELEEGGENAPAAKPGKPKPKPPQGESEDAITPLFDTVPPVAQSTRKIRRDQDGLDDMPTEAEARRQARITAGGDKRYGQRRQKRG
jgi:uncharacterized protein